MSCTFPFEQKNIIIIIQYRQLLLTVENVGHFQNCFSYEDILFGHVGIFIDQGKNELCVILAAFLVHNQYDAFVWDWFEIERHDNPGV